MMSFRIGFCNVCIAIGLQVFIFAAIAEYFFVFARSKSHEKDSAPTLIHPPAELAIRLNAVNALGCTVIVDGIEPSVSTSVEMHPASGVRHAMVYRGQLLALSVSSEPTGVMLPTFLGTLQVPQSTTGLPTAASVTCFDPDLQPLFEAQARLVASNVP